MICVILQNLMVRHYTVVEHERINLVLELEDLSLLANFHSVRRCYEDAVIEKKQKTKN